MSFPYTPVPVDEKLLKKTRLGLVKSFSEIFTGVRYVKTESTPHRGSITYYGPGEMFLWAENYVGLDVPPSTGRNKVLACKPIVELTQFCGRIGSNDPDLVPPSCIHLIPWAKQGVWLVLEGDPNSIRDEWLAFVPLDQRFEVQE